MCHLAFLLSFHYDCLVLDLLRTLILFTPLCSEMHRKSPKEVLLIIYDIPTSSTWL